ncbi:MAG: hypothetical protein WDZ53_09835, partial [Balneolales bacterium]
DNALFLQSFAEALSAQKNTRGIILHGDSRYTERLIQTGMLTDDARKRSSKDLNHRLVALLADSGVAAVGINAYQRRTVRYDGSVLTPDRTFLTGFPQDSHLLLSNLVEDTRSAAPLPYDLAEMARSLYRLLDLDELFVFPKNESAEIPLTESAHLLPEDLQRLKPPYRLVSFRSFGRLPDLK